MKSVYLARMWNDLHLVIKHKIVQDRKRLLGPLIQVDPKNNIHLGVNLLNMSDNNYKALLMEKFFHCELNFVHDKHYLMRHIRSNLHSSI